MSLLYWLRFPFVRYALVLSGSIYIYKYNRFLSIEYLLFISCFFFCLYILTYFFFNETIKGVAGLLTIMFCGFLSVELHDNSRSPFISFSNISSADNYVLVLTDKPTVKTEKSLGAEGEIIYFRNRDRWRKGSVRLQIFFPRSDSTLYNEGDTLLINNSPERMEEPVIPGAFNYAGYMANKGIYFRDYLKGERIIRSYASGKQSSPLSGINTYVTTALRRVLLKPNNFGIAKALMIGDRSGLSRDLRSDFANAGTIHVLAVSGLHVGIIFILLKSVFIWLSNRWIRLVIILSGLWIYALITGMSPSVMRSALMFSVVVLAGTLSRNSNVFNSIGIAGFFLLLLDPNLLYSVGFQMSFLAVIGIVLFQPPIYNIFQPGSRVLDYIWKLVSVSIAAQILTFPLSLYYFNQFPTYFIISNIFVIPLVTILLILGCTYLLLAFINPVAIALGFLFSLSLDMLNGIVKIISELPNSTLSSGYVSAETTVLIYGLILVICLLFHFREALYLYIIMFFTLFIITVDILQINNKRCVELFIYASGGEISLDFVQKRHAFSYGEADSEKLRYSIFPNREYNHITKSSAIRSIPINNEMELFVFNGNTFVLVKSPYAIKYLDWFDEIDYLILDKSSNFKIPAGVPVGKIIIFNNRYLEKFSHRRYNILPCIPNYCSIVL